MYVTHDQQEALALAHRIVAANHARVEQLDEPSGSIVFQNCFVADFIGTCNILDAEAAWMASANSSYVSMDWEKW